MKTAAIAASQENAVTAVHAAVASVLAAKARNK